MPKTIYLDHAAATPLDKRVADAMEPYYSDLFYNPSATYNKGIAAKMALNKFRSQVAQLLGAKTSEIVFTAGGSEANSLAVKGIMDNYPNANLVISPIEHDSVLKPAMRYKYKLSKVDVGGIIDLKDLANKVDDKTVLISVMQVNNEIGTIQPINKLSQLVSTIRQDRITRGIKLPLYLHSDACQAANYLDVHISRLGVDLLTVNAGKLYGPKQTGLLFVKAGVKLRPLIEGGGQEHGLRSGTESIANAAAMATSLEIAQSLRKTETERLTKLRDYFSQQLLKIRPDIILNGNKNHKLANNLHFTIPGVDNEKILFNLDNAGILAAAGSACSASSVDPSHVLSAIGLDERAARSSIRISLGRSTTEDDIKTSVKVLKSLI
jgi:cysteine desulfurase